MSDIERIDIEEIRKKIPEFIEKTNAFYDGDLSVKDYKGFSGRFGSYAQRGKKANMLRLRMNAGQLTKDKMKFAVDMADKYDINPVHFTTCQTIQLHNLAPEAVYDIMDKALDVGIITYGGGGDYPRNVMCSPLSGVEEEYFDVMPYARAVSEFLIPFVDKEKMPRKLKVGFSNNPDNAPHATFRDLGFMARPDGTFDVYAAGGLGNNPRFGVLVDEKVPKDQILYDVEAMIELFKKHGNYENRAKARTRYLQETLGEEGLREEFQKELAALKASKDLTLTDVQDTVVNKTGYGTELEESFLVLRQKQPGLYSVRFHPLGGSPKRQTLRALYEAIKDMDEVELRLAPDETAYIINLNGTEAKKVLSIIEEEAARNPFESSIACIGASICQVGLRDSQSLLDKSLKTVREAGLPDNALPKMHISGCPSSCGTHQVGSIGFRGAVKVVDKKPLPAFVLFAGGNDKMNQEAMAREIGTLLEDDIPAFLVDLGQTVAATGKSYDEWIAENPNGIDEVAAKYM